MRNSIIAIVAVILIAGGWYYSADRENMGTNGGEQNEDTTPAAILRVAYSDTLGDFLVAENGMTLYVFANDASGVSNCSGQCAVNWPPYTAFEGQVLNGGDGVSGSIGTIKRADGTLQITYNNLPLYFWKNDKKPGDTTGHNVNQAWFVVKPEDLQ